MPSWSLSTSSLTEPRWADDARPNGLGENPNVQLETYVVACRETARMWRVPLIDHFAAAHTLDALAAIEGDLACL